MTRETNPVAKNEVGGGPGVLARIAARLMSGGWGAPAPRTKRPSGVLKTLLFREEGNAYDRQPCPHALTVWDEVPDPQRPEDRTRMRMRRTLVACERPGAHVSEEADAARVHSGAGKVW